MDQNPSAVPIKTRSMWSNVVFVWFVITGVYSILTFVFYANLISNANSYYYLVQKITHLIGLFVPFGPNELPFILILGPILIIELLFTHFLYNKLRLIVWQKFLLILIALFILTIINDIILFNSYVSWHLFVTGVIPQNILDKFAW